MHASNFLRVPSEDFTIRAYSSFCLALRWNSKIQPLCFVGPHLVQQCSLTHSFKKKFHKSLISWWFITEVAIAFFARRIDIASVFGVLISTHHPCLSSMYSRRRGITIKLRHDTCAHMHTHMCVTIESLHLYNVLTLAFLNLREFLFSQLRNSSALQAITFVPKYST